MPTVLPLGSAVGTSRPLLHDSMFPKCKARTAVLLSPSFLARHVYIFGTCKPTVHGVLQHDPCEHIASVHGLGEIAQLLFQRQHPVSSVGPWGLERWSCYFKSCDGAGMQSVRLPRVIGVCRADIVCSKLWFMQDLESCILATISGWERLYGFGWHFATHG
jgi:hypothetical protein